MSKLCTGKPWGYIAPSVPNAPKCISSCRHQFLETLLSSTNSASDDDETFARACETLSDKNQINNKDHPFWRLYCCDAQRCGVDNVERLGEDPNINWIINTCSNIGFASIIDPGPPESTYTCPYEAINNNNPQCQLLKDTPSTTSTATSSQSIEILTQDTMIPSITRNLLSDPTISSIVDPSLTSSTIPTHTTNSDDSDAQKYSIGEQVAIAVSVVVGIVVLAAAILCLFRIRTMHKRRSQTIHAQDERLHSPHSSHFTPSTPPPSLRGANGEPLTPPPRLRERRLLPSGLSISSWTSSGFPENPLSAPMKAKLIPRREEMRRAASTQAAPLLGWSREDSSIHSGSSYTASSSAHSARTRSELASISSKHHIRHPSRVHSLASPGPAPNKKLPPTPTSLSPRRTLSPTRHGDVGVAIGIVGHNPASGVALSGPSRDLCELTEEYEREARSSGGSWSGKGGGGPGVTVVSRQTDQQGTTVRLGEDDLQRMGGGY